jgi:hypothetical protein
MMTVNEMIDWIRTSTKATFAAEHPIHYMVNWNDDLAGQAFELMGMYWREVEEGLGDGPSREWVSMLYEAEPNLIERHFEHVPDKAWLRQLLLQHPELLTPQFHAINVDLSLHIETAIADDLDLFAEELQAWHDLEVSGARKA